MNALLITDIQNDFLPGGALAVPEGDQIIPLVNRLQADFPIVVATQDWHPADHGSFASNHPGKKPGDVIDLFGIPQILWPDHCVQRSHGAELAKELDTNRIQKIFYKGVEKNIDSYSTFFDNAHRRSTGLEEYLREAKVDSIYLVGLATDYCVKYSALDGCRLGFETYVIEEGCRGIELKKGDVARAMAEMKEAGVHVIPTYP